MLPHPAALVPRAARANTGLGLRWLVHNGGLLSCLRLNIDLSLFMGDNRSLLPSEPSHVGHPWCSLDPASPRAADGGPAKRGSRCVWDHRSVRLVSDTST